MDEKARQAWLEELGGKGLADLPDLWGVDSVEAALTYSDRIPENGEDHRSDLLWDVLDSVVQEVFRRLIIDGVSPGECVATLSECGRNFAVWELGWQPTRRSIAPRIRTLVFRRDGYACVDCGEDDVRKLTLDHRIPVALGGTNESGNLITRCKSCNSSKGVTLR